MPSSDLRQPFSLAIIVLVLAALVCQALSAGHSSLSLVPPDQQPVAPESDTVSPDTPRAENSQGAIHTPGLPTISSTPLNREHPALTPHTLRIVAVGDIHGDYDALVEVLQMTGVVDDDKKWTGEADYLVQTGDIIDRGPDTTRLYNYMDALRSEAREWGGSVVSLMGNHEYMNARGDWRYVFRSEMATFGSSDDRLYAVSKGSIGTSWRTHYKVACRLPLHPSLGPLNTVYDSKKTSPLSHAAISFVHGGLSPTYPDLTPFPSRINTLGRSALVKLQQNPRSELTADEHRLTRDNNGPLWYRGWNNKSDKEVCAEVDDVLERTGTRRMVMGHSPQLDKKGIRSRCGGKIIIIDTGISSWFERSGGTRSALSIDYTLLPRPQSGRNAGPPVWDEREIVTVHHEDGREDEIVNFHNEISGYLDSARDQ